MWVVDSMSKKSDEELREHLILTIMCINGLITWKKRVLLPAHCTFRNCMKASVPASLARMPFKDSILAYRKYMSDTFLSLHLAMISSLFRMAVVDCASSLSDVWCMLAAAPIVIITDY